MMHKNDSNSPVKNSNEEQQPKASVHVEEYLVFESFKPKLGIGSLGILVQLVMSFFAIDFLFSILDRVEPLKIADIVVPSYLIGLAFFLALPFVMFPGYMIARKYKDKHKFASSASILFIFTVGLAGFFGITGLLIFFAYLV